MAKSSRNQGVGYREKSPRWDTFHIDVAGVDDLLHIRGMKVRVFEADTEIGEAEVFALDPPMCVAMAKFTPSLAYDVERHANVIDAEYVADRGEALRIELSSGDPLKSEVISIQDLPTLGECELHLIGIYEPAFDELFGSHPDFLVYWGKA